jgi:hypothetical protein
MVPRLPLQWPDAGGTSTRVHEQVRRGLQDYRIQAEAERFLITMRIAHNVIAGVFQNRT